MSAKKGTLWPAPPHTIAKIEMLRKYLRLWFEILGRTYVGRELWYIDGFAGPGEYTNYSDGSPVAAIKAAGDALDIVGSRVPAIRCAFIEENRKRFEHLQRKLVGAKIHAKVQVLPIHGTFVEGMKVVRAAIAPNSPTFAFLDPFGPEGLPFTLVKELLSRPACEVLINLDSDGIGRIYAAGGWANHKALLDSTFGDSDWEQELATAPDLQSAIPQIVSLYKRKLFALPDVKYFFPFEMRKKSGSLDYHLVFASRHPLGLEKMKEVMKSMDHTGTYAFVDSYVHQHELFRDDDEAIYVDRTAKHFAGQRVSYDEVNRYVLNETIYTKAGQILAPLERGGRVIVTTPYAARRRFTFPKPSRTGMYIQF